MAVLVWEKSFVALFPSFHLYSTHFCQFFPFPQFSIEPHIKKPQFQRVIFGRGWEFFPHGIFFIFDLCTRIDPISSQSKPPGDVFPLRSKNVPVMFGIFWTLDFGFLQTWHRLYGLWWTLWCILALKLSYEYRFINDPLCHWKHNETHW